MENLPPNIAEACRPLFEALPLEQSMNLLVGSEPKHTELIQQIIRTPEIAANPALIAGLWLYVDDLERSHVVGQSIEDATGSYWHGIMHRREGDFSNSHYWLRRAAGHVLFDTNPELDSSGLIDAVAKTHGQNTPELVTRQREEWQTLFAWCATNK